jgi:hypothetical protein
MDEKKIGDFGGQVISPLPPAQSSAHECIIMNGVEGWAPSADEVLLQTKTNVSVIVGPAKKNGFYKLIMNRTASRITFYLVQKF